MGKPPRGYERRSPDFELRPMVLPGAQSATKSKRDKQKAREHNKRARQNRKQNRR